MKKEEISTALLNATKQGFEVLSGAIAPEDTANDLPIGKHRFIPNGGDCYDVKRITVGKDSTSRYAGKQIAFVVTQGKVNVGNKSVVKNIGGEHTGEIDCWVTLNGKYNRLTAYEPKVEVLNA